MFEMRFVSASDDVAAYQAVLCNRQAATAAWTAANWPADAAAWLFSREAYEMGLDPWRQVSIDVTTDDTGDVVLYDDTRDRDWRAPGDTRVFVQLRDLPTGMVPPAGEPAQLSIRHTLLWVDGPMLVRAEDARGFEYLAVACDERPGPRVVWMAARHSAETLERYMRNEVLSRAMFTELRAGALLAGSFDDGEPALFHHRAEPDDAELPDAAVYLHP
ncbi:hypothetical protein CKO28_13775 [Rhodovibrio sodomensis]|uniref:Carbohydrate-binding domain-containing protein n=1 Tax=Rhodovibrio sodomensis TaxID=1088 RepID=A0ABS1DFT7_9PROT|nr:hypothetical protein [Rhodovibrio sodomensis]MBK1669103.1 hypothetical protein [Rhodovibrio sodomensis]